MKRVSLGLARGIVFAAALLTSGRLADTTPSSLQRALFLLEKQDFTPVFDLAGQRIQAYFDPDRQARFLDEIFSLSGKWKAATRGRDSYERYVRRTFEKYVFNPDQFRGVLEVILQDYGYAVAAIENRLLVSLYEDLRPEHPELTFGAFQVRYDTLAGMLAPHVLHDLAINGVSILGSEAAATILAAALTSAGILGGSVAAGTTGGPWSFGVSLVVGLAIALVIEETAGRAYEDAARMELRRHVNALRNRVVEDVMGAIAHALLNYRRLQEECVRALFEGGPDERVALGR